MRRAFRAWTLAAVLAAPMAAQTATYDPRAVPAGFEPRTLDLAVHDSKRDRDIPVLVYLPQEQTPAPVVLFSHGLGGSRNNNAYLGEHWSARGYVGVFVQHPGSDEAVWQDVGILRRRAALKDAADLKNFAARAADIPAVLDQLERWNRDRDHPLHGRLNLEHVGMSGHSFGALTTQAVSGQQFGRGLLDFTDERIDAAVAFSPSAPRMGSAGQAFGKVAIPWMLMTGTKDVAAIGNATLESRLAVYPALPPGGKYELVLYNAEHSAFSDRALPGDRGPRNPNHHVAITALSTAFWDAMLRDDADARAWLDGDGARSVLEEQDRWQRK